MPDSKPTLELVQGGRLEPLYRVCAMVGEDPIEFLADRQGWLPKEFDPTDARYYTHPGAQDEDSFAYLQELFVLHEAEWLTGWLQETYPGIAKVEIYPEDLPIPGYYAILEPSTFRVYHGDASNGLPFSIAALILPQPDNQDPDETRMRAFFEKQRAVRR